MAAAYGHKSQAVDRVQRRLANKEAALFDAELAHDNERGWFPWFASQQQKAYVAKLRAVRDHAAAETRKVELELAHAQRAANQELGLFSNFSIRQAKQRFWDSFERAKIIGRRQTFWDGLFHILGSRDREMMDVFVSLAMYLVGNMAAAMFLMFWIFLWGLPSFIWTFGASWAQSIVFFALATVAAAAVMVSFVGLLAGAAGGTVYGLARLTGRTARLGGPRPDGRRRLQGQAVPGYTHVQFGREHYYRPQPPGHAHHE